MTGGPGIQEGKQAIPVEIFLVEFLGQGKNPHDEPFMFQLVAPVYRHSRTAP